MNNFSEYAGHGEAILRSLSSNAVNSENLIEFDIGRNEQWFSDIDLAEQSTLALCNILKQTTHLRMLNLSYNGLNGAQLEQVLSSLRQTSSILTMKSLNLAGSRPTGQEAEQLVGFVHEAK